MPPIRNAIAAAQKPIVSEERPAYSITDRISRPRLSVPSRCCADGGCIDGEPRSIGPVVANRGAKIDSSEIAMRMTAPMPPKRVRNRRRSRSSAAEARDRLNDFNTGSALGSTDIGRN